MSAAHASMRRRIEPSHTVPQSRGLSGTPTSPSGSRPASIARERLRPARPLGPLGVLGFSEEPLSKPIESRRNGISATNTFCWQWGIELPSTRQRNSLSSHSSTTMSEVCRVTRVYRASDGAARPGSPCIEEMRSKAQIAPGRWSAAPCRMPPSTGLLPAALTTCRTSS